jgi:Ca2+-binding EF-hand superfamily protein
MDESEFRNIMIDIGERSTTEEAAKAMLAAHDNNRDGVLSFSEFVDMMIEFKGKKPDAFGTL